MATMLEMTLYGTLPSGERWSVNPCYLFTGTAALSVVQLQAVGNAVEGVTVPSTLLGLLSSSCTMTGVKILQRQLADGELMAAVDWPFTVAKVGTGNATKPFQTSVVLSLRTTDTRPRGKGRLYWPGLGATIGTPGLRISSTDLTAYLTNFNTYFTNLRNAIDGALPSGPGVSAWAVYSRRFNDQSAVATLMVGDLLDVQRRRRDRAPESYATVAFV